jgi:TonB family protein
VKRRITSVLLAFGLAHACWSQDSRKKSLPPECTKPTRVHGSYPKGPFKIFPAESYKRSPTIKFEIQEDGTVTNAVITRKSGVADIDQEFLDAITRWKYKPRPAGCGVIENEMTGTIDWAASQ